VIVSLSRTAAPASLPVSLAEAKAHLRVDGTADDALIQAYLEAAVETVEAMTGRCLMLQDWEVWFKDFPEWDGPLEPPHAPLVSVTAVRTLSAAGTLTTLPTSAYQVAMPAGPRAGRGHIWPAASTSWPVTDTDVLGPVRVTYRAGYVEPPAALCAAVLLFLGDAYANREAANAANIRENPAIARLIAPFALFWG
jgi:uncharacterized phiE125 gp8 family phage protein